MKRSQEKSFIAFTWLTCHILEQQETLALNIGDVIRGYRCFTSKNSADENRTMQTSLGIYRCRVQ